MAEFRYQAITVDGKPLQGYVYASNKHEARRKVSEIASGNGFRVKAIHKRVPYYYKIRKADNGRVLKGEITGFTHQEVLESIHQMGYSVLALNRNYVTFKPPIPEKDIVIFIRLCADLLREKFPYDEILQLLANDIENRTLRDIILEIHKDLRAGKEGKQVYLKHSDALGKFTTLMLSIASTSGNMAEIYENTAKFLDRSSEFKKNLRSVLFMPTIVLFASIAAVIFYVAYIFPQIAGLLLKYDVKVPPLTAKTLAISTFFQNNIFWLVPAALLPIILLVIFFRTDRGKVLGARIVMSLPVVGRLFQRNSIEVFARVFHALYSGSGENIEALKVASEACRNAYMEKQIKEHVIPSMLREGRSLSDSLESAGIFPRNAIYTLRSGEESGTLREATFRLANFYEKETTHKISRVVDLINLIITIFVSLLIIGITLLSTEIGFVSPPTTNFLG